MNDQMGVRGRAVSPPNQMEEVSIQKMREDDLPAVLAIENVSFPTPFTEHLFRMELKLNVAHIYVARLSSQDKVAGYVDYWRVGPEVHIITIAVHPEFRRHHIGTALIDFMLADARKSAVETVSLDVRPSNTAAIALYQKYGFSQIGRRKAYYQDNNEDALVLGLTLKQEK